MKKRFTYLLSFLFAVSLTTVVFAQATHTIDFEPSGVGATWNWVVAENSDNPPLEFIANPVSGGINTSATVAKFTARQTGNPWALFFTDDDGEFTFDASNCIVKIMVYKPVITPVHIKIEGGTGAALELVDTNTVTNQWEELTYDFSSRIGSTFSRLVIIPDFLARGQDNIIYIDNIQVPDGIIINLTEPTTPAPTPTVHADSVISVFSDVYTDIAGTNFNPNWGQSTAVSFVTISGDTTMKYATLNYQGIELGSHQNLTSAGMEYLHIDFWTPNSTDLGVYLISPGPVEKEVSLIPSGTTETWNSVDIPLSSFSGVDLSDVFQFKFEGNGTVYLDNIYFFKGGTTPTEPTVAAPTPTHSSDKVISLFSDAYTNVTVDTWRTVWSSANYEEVNIASNPTKKYTSLDFVGIETVSSQIDITSMTHFHLDVWSPNFTLFGVKLVDFGANASYGGGDDTEHQINFPSLNQEEWVSLDIPLSDFTGLTGRQHIAQLILVGQPTSLTTVYVDNVYFYDSTTSGIKDLNEAIPSEYALEQNYPNPFNPTTNIRFSLPEASNVTLKVFNILGEEVRTLLNQFMSAGQYEFTFDASNLPAGVYIYNLSTDNFQSVKKMMLLK